MKYHVQYGKLLKKQVENRMSRVQIGSSAHTFYLDKIEQLNSKMYNLLIGLTMMEMGPEFEYSYEELEKIADDLIAGKDVVLD